MSESAPAVQWKYSLTELAFDAAEEQAVLEVVRSRWVSMGPKTAALEEEVCKLTGSPYALAMSNCTTALHLALLAANIGFGDEVIVPSLTFAATANAVLYVGATPIFADITSLERPLLDPQAVREKVSSRTKAVIVMHYGGAPCDMSAFRALCDELNLVLIEDSAHAFGTVYDGKVCGTIGDLGCYSFFANKNIPAGEGGMLLTKNEEMYRRAKLLRSHGMTSLSWDRFKGHAFSYDIVDLGYNFRTTELSAALAIAQIKKLPVTAKSRNICFEHYAERLSKMGKILVPLTGMTGVNRHLAVVLLPKDISREGIMDELRKSGVQSSIHYLPVHQFTYYRRLPAMKDVSLPKTEEFSQRTLTLPLHPLLTIDAVDEICAILSGVVLQAAVK